MPTRFKVLAVAAALMASTSGAAIAQCTPGYTYYNGACQLAPGYSNLVSGAASGLAAGTANGNATGGAVGAIEVDLAVVRGGVLEINEVVGEGEAVDSAARGGNLLDHSRAGKGAVAQK